MSAIQAQWLPSSSQDAAASMQITAFPDFGNAYIGWGISAGTPATFGALTSSGSDSVAFATPFSLTLAPGVANIATSRLMPALGAAGNNAWICLFHTAPAGGSVPLSVAGPFVVQG